MTFLSGIRLKTIGVAMLLALAGLQAQASSVSVQLEFSNFQPAFPDGGDYIDVTISDGNTEGDIDFSVTLLDPLMNVVVDWSNFGLNAFSLNLGHTGATAENLVLPLDWYVGESHWDRFGAFGVDLVGDYLKTNLRFSISGVEGDTPEDYLNIFSIGGNPSVMFAAQVVGLSSNPDWKNIWPHPDDAITVQFGGPAVVPIPAAAWLFLSAFGFLAWRRYRQTH